MLRIFLAMRQLLAQAFKVVLGEIPLTIIDDRWLPALNARLENTTDYEEASKLMDVIELWKEYRHGGRHEGLWSGIAKKAVVRVFRGDEQAAEEAAADIASNLWENQNFINKFNPEDGPQDFLRVWTAVVNNQAKKIRRDKSELLSLYTLRENRNEEGDMSINEELGLPPPTDEDVQVDKETLRLIDRDFRKFMMSEARNDPVLMDVFNGWVKAVKKNKSLHKVMPFREVFPQLMKSYEKAGKSVGKSTFGKKWRKFQKLIVEFFSKELGKEVGRRVKEKLKMSAVDVLIFEKFRRRFAVWMLQPIFKYRAARWIQDRKGENASSGI